MKIGDIEIDVFGDTDPKKMPMHKFYGALELRYDTAVRANVDRQNYSVCPRHWFIEAVFRCAGCGREFTFSVKEQRFWYETRRFYSDSYPTHCPRCRKYGRTKLALKQEYDETISAALLRSASLSSKRKAIQVIDALAVASESVSAKMRKNRLTLVEQIRGKEA